MTHSLAFGSQAASGAHAFLAVGSLSVISTYSQFPSDVAYAWKSKLPPLPAVTCTNCGAETP